jgi:hypothetical protein
MMVLSKFSVYFGGILSLLMAIFHSRLSKLFNWENEFKNISKQNQLTFSTINYALVVIFLLLSFISFVYADELIQKQRLSIGILLTISIFLGWRTIWQLTYYRIPKGMKLYDRRLFLHYSLTLIFIALTMSYLIPMIVH